MKRGKELKLDLNPNYKNIIFGNQSNCNNTYLKDGGDLLGGDGNIVISEDEGGVDAGELRVGHF